MALRVATFNLLDFFEPAVPSQAAAVDAKVRTIAAELARADADVVAFQEVGSHELFDRLLDTHARPLGYIHRVVGQPDRRGIRCAMASRRPLLYAAVHQVDDIPFPRLHVADPEPFAGRIPLRRAVVQARVADPLFGEVDLLTAHFKSKLPRRLEAADGSFVDDVTAADHAASSLRSLVLRAAEALHVRRLVDRLLGEQRHVCVLGDLNDTLDSLPVRIVRGAERGVDPTLVLSDATSALPEDRRFSVRFGGRGEQIDQILASISLADRVTGAGIQNEALRDFGPFDPNAPPSPDSDHALVWASLG